jgi:FlaA1/EpsC-like NDP-sugar epimerase
MLRKVALGFLYLFCCQCIAEISNQQLFENKNIMILGGTGFLGKGIATQVLKYNPKQVVIFSRDEFKQFNVAKMFGFNPKIKCVIGDIRDYDQLLRAMKDIDIVFHTAALKRMDTLEDNVEQAIKTNVLGSVNVFNACAANHVKNVIFISTDKACSPVNAYGAAKFLSEKLFCNYDKTLIDTKFCCVRFGNILDSTGSIIPLFTDIIKQGKDITLTDSRMTRFVVTKEEAFELMCDVLRYAVGGEIFIRKLSSAKVTDVIDVLKTYFKANNPVKITGLRPGEKFHEELLNRAEVSHTYEFRNYYVVIPTIKGWLSSLTEEPVYIKDGRLLNEKIMTGFASDQALISQEQLTKVLQDAGLFH